MGETVIELCMERYHFTAGGLKHLRCESARRSVSAGGNDFQAALKLWAIR